MSTSKENRSPDTFSTQCAAWKLPVFLALVLLALIGGQFLLPDKQPAPAQADTPIIGSVTQAIDNGADPLREAVYELRSEITVLDLLLTSDEQAEVSGAGAAAFVTSIDGRANQGLDGWQYEVNGHAGRRSAAVEPLRPGDRILWKYAPYE